MPRSDRPTPRSGIVVIDKPGGMTSHDVVARVRRLVGTRKVGHAGTLDPMATGVLIVGVERATRLLGHLMGHDKTYTATVRLGVATTTDDREGEVLAATAATHLSEQQVRAAFAGQVGHRAQVPSSVSAKKIGGRRAYDLVREGQEVELAPREVDIHSVDVHEVRSAQHHDDAATAVLDVDITVRCGAGTYIRAIARDVGAELGVGGHLTALRRTASGEITEHDAVSLERLADLAEPVVLSLDEVARRIFPARALTAAEASDLSFGRRLAPYGDDPLYAAVDESGCVVALVAGSGKPSVVFRPA